MGLIHLNFNPPHRIPQRPNGRRLGYKRGPHDLRDHPFIRVAPALPESVDLTTSPFMPPVYDQGQLGSCTSQGWAACFQFDQRKLGKPDFMPSRLEIYYLERQLDGTVGQDAGAQIRDGAKVLSKWGVSREELWPYIENKFKYPLPPSVVNDPNKEFAVTYEKVDNSKADNLRHALALGFPVVFGATLYESFESEAAAATGVIPMPTRAEAPIGGHCQVVVGYTPTFFIVRNSWGTSWGVKGYSRMPIEYLTNTELANDFWILETLS
jgi:C1A family cysteine protease